MVVAIIQHVSVVEFLTNNNLEHNIKELTGVNNYVLLSIHPRVKRSMTFNRSNSFMEDERTSAFSEILVNILKPIYVL